DGGGQGVDVGGGRAGERHGRRRGSLVGGFEQRAFARFIGVRCRWFVPVHAGCELQRHGFVHLSRERQEPRFERRDGDDHGDAGERGAGGAGRSVYGAGGGGVGGGGGDGRAGERHGRGW